ncbi:MAG: D-glycero-beta-D-manno-heptose-7-phosphate kinase [Leptospirillum sp.]
MIEKVPVSKDLVSLDRLLEVLSRMSDSRVVVAGDAILDRYVWGKVSRISPEAPVPVVNVTHESVRLGGACNVVHNIQKLGGRSALLSVVGEDANGQKLLSEMEKEHVDVSGVLSVPVRPTTTKTRVIAHSQQLLRYDEEDRGELPGEVQEELLARLRGLLPGAGVFLLSDYAKGVLSTSFAQKAMLLAKELGVPTFVDPKVATIDSFQGATILTPNNLEASQSSGFEIDSEESLLKAGRTLISRLNCGSLLITRGEMGMTLFENPENLKVFHIPSVAQNVYDVTGAGDTVIASMSLAFSSGASLLESAVLANIAAGYVVGIVGTAAISNGELEGVLRQSPLFDRRTGTFVTRGYGSDVHK